MSTFSKRYKRFRERVANLAPRTKLVIALAGALLVVILISVLLIFIAGQKKLNDESGMTAEEKAAHQKNMNETKRDGEIRDSAQKAIDEGNVTKANEVYQNAIASEQETVRKIQLSIDQSELLYNAGKVSEAFEVAKQAEKLSDDKYLIADWLSRIYEDQKQFKLAAEYYKLAGQWADSETNEAALTKNYYEREAARVAARKEVKQ